MPRTSTKAAVAVAAVALLAASAAAAEPKPEGRKLMFDPSAVTGAAGQLLDPATLEATIQPLLTAIPAIIPELLDEFGGIGTVGSF